MNFPEDCFQSIRNMLPLPPQLMSTAFKFLSLNEIDHFETPLKLYEKHIVSGEFNLNCDCGWVRSQKIDVFCLESDRWKLGKIIADRFAYVHSLISRNFVEMYDFFFRISISMSWFDEIFNFLRSPLTFNASARYLKKERLTIGCFSSRITHDCGHRSG